MKIHLTIVLLALAGNAFASKYHDRVRGVTHHRKTLTLANRSTEKKAHLPAMMHAAERTARKPRHLYVNEDD